MTDDMSFISEDDRVAIRSTDAYDENQNLTTEEKRWISRAKRLFREQPDGIYVVSCDGDLTILKKGVFVDDYSDSIGDITTECAVVSDVSDWRTKEFWEER